MDSFLPYDDVDIFSLKTHLTPKCTVKLFQNNYNMIIASDLDTLNKACKFDFHFFVFQET